MGRTPQDVTDTELAILQMLWDHGPCTRRQITDVLYPRGGPAHYATVQKLLERLETKGFVSAVNRGQPVLSFTVTVDRDELISRKLAEMADKLCGGSMTPLLMNLVRAQSLTTRQLDELRSLIEDLRRQAKRKGERRS
jgi:predicted transcriptional regulator